MKLVIELSEGQQEGLKELEQSGVPLNEHISLCDIVECGSLGSEYECRVCPIFRDFGAKLTKVEGKS